MDDVNNFTRPRDAKELPQPEGIETKEVPQGLYGDRDYHQFTERESMIEAIAVVCHEANRAYCDVVMNDRSQAPWNNAPLWQRDSARTGVRVALGGATPEELHESWMAQKLAEGWVYGPVKDPVHKTHPCLVEYADLPELQRRKDHLFRAVVSALSLGL